MARGDEAGARADLERAIALAKGYDGPPLQRIEMLVALVRLLPPTEGERIAALRAEARSELAAVKPKAPPDLASAITELEQALGPSAGSGPTP